MRLDPFAALVLRGALERARPGLVHLTDPYTAHLAPRGVPVLMTVYDLLLLDAPGRLPALFTRGIRSLQARQDVHWLAISTTVAREVQQRLGVVAASLTVASPGPTAWPDSGATPYDGLLVVGALDAHKRPEHAVEAARAAGLPVLFAGRHEPHLVEVLGLAPASLAADLDDAALAARIRGARAVVHASSSEGFGLPVLEALSLQTPVIAYDLPVTREIVGPDYPLVPEAEGPAGLARLAGELADPAVRAAALAAAAPTVAGHSWQRSRDVVRRLHDALG